MKLSRTVAYAIRATLLLADSNSRGPVPCSQLAAAGHMPERFLLQILRNLVTHGILHSTRGVDGGYSLERRPEDISLLELIEALEGPVGATLPDAAGVDPSGHQVKLRAALERIALSERRSLQAVRLSDLLGSPSAST